MNGGYEEGYRACPCFWGDKPGSLVAQVISSQNHTGKSVLDLGCGEGKNAAAFARAGASVVAIDCSETAISNGKAAFKDLGIAWHVGEALEFPLNDRLYDIVVMYGLLHCMPSEEIIYRVIERAVRATSPGGMHILATFNDRSHDLEVAHPGFYPTLLPHAAYLSAYANQEVIQATDSTLEETHPHNGVLHHHSLTRMIIRIK